MKHRLSILVPGLVLLASAVVAAPAANDPADSKVTWSDHVAPILHENCVSCHRPGQTAPMSLLTYDETRPWAKSIRRVVTERSMPPWFASPEHGEFVEDPSLTDAEIETLSRWVAAGAPSGDLSRAPEAPSFSLDWKLGTPDAVYTGPEFQVSDDVEDHYEWLQVDNPVNEERWIKAIEIHPGLVEAVHHQLTYLAPPDATLAGVQSRTGTSGPHLRERLGTRRGAASVCRRARDAHAAEQLDVLPDALPQDSRRGHRRRRPDDHGPLLPRRKA